MNRLLRVAASVLVLGGMPVAALADDPYNYAEVWNAWSLQARSAYLRGLADGRNHAFAVAAIAWLPRGEAGTARIRRVHEELFLQFEAATLEPVMTELYRDPANVFIEFSDMADVARDKIKGSDVQAHLLQARRNAVEGQKLLELLKKK